MLAKPLADVSVVTAARYLGRNVRRLRRHLGGLPRARDPESVHQVRVACRCLRAGVRVFRKILGKERANRWRSALRDLASGLGKARDTDVQIAAMLGRLGESDDPEIRHGMVFWIAGLELARSRCQPQIRQAVRRFLRTGTLREMREWLSDAKRTLATTAGEFEAPPAGYQKHLLRRMGRFLEYSDSLRDEWDIARHHEFRIAAKKFRYTLEICAPVLGADFEVALEAVREMQSYLGEIHDCDVWVAELEGAVRRLEAGEKLLPGWMNQERFVVGLDFLKESCRERRRQLFAAACAFWHDEKVAALWPRIAAALKEPRRMEDSDAAGCPA
ncbi:MAG: CHAD domain-containing protein [Thermogutta sp.]|nr:CHAD domain-containing protein [Thermogutta sp.]